MGEAALLLAAAGRSFRSSCPETRLFCFNLKERKTFVFRSREYQELGEGLWRGEGNLDPHLSPEL